MNRFKVGDILIHKKCEYNDWYKKQYKLKVIKSLNEFQVEVLQDIYHTNGRLWYKKGTRFYHHPEKYLLYKKESKSHLPEWL